MALTIDTLPLGPLETNCYVLTSAGVCWLVDVGMWPRPLIDFLRARGLTPECILLTHGHGDHIAGVEMVREHWPGVRLLCPAADADMLGDPQANLSGPFGFPMTAPPADRLVEPGEEMLCGELTLHVLDTSGHSPGGVSYYCPQAGVVLCGDALFAGGVGRSDIPGADGERLAANIRANLYTLPDDTRVLPGHGPESTIGAEKAGNPFVRP